MAPAAFLPQPPGFVYQSDFISRDEEHTLAARIREMEFSAVVMRGQTAKRGVVHLGWLYGYESFRITPGPPGPPVPEWLVPLRARAAELGGITGEELAEALITEYPAGAVIGWHRDAPPFGVVIAVSLLGACRLRLRRKAGEKCDTREVQVAPRSAYLLGGEARSQWQHSIPAVKELRYSITFRTLRSRMRE